jgi:PHD/YefM family antitoxin component YafN of YafNO toxin-antitoxin module
MALDEMTPEEFRQKLDELLGEEYFPPIAVTRDGEPRLVVVPIVAWRSMRRGSRKVISAGEMSEEDLKAIAEAKVPEGLEHLNDLLKDD